MGDLVMFDSTDLGQIPADAACVAGYVGGRWPTAREIPHRFPRARLLTIAVTAAEDAETLDIETGDATPADAAGWFERQRRRGVPRPCLYASASVMAAVVAAIRAAGIERGAVRLWSAHYTHSPHICGPKTCGAVSLDVDGTQWTDKALGRNLDLSLLRGDFFAVPAPPARPPTVRQPRPWTTAGQSTLAELAAGQRTQPSTILRLTAEKSPGAVYAPEVASYLNSVFRGEVDPKHPMPAGLRLWLPG